jgi:oligopeptide/dipeptide ABC transporter ATP-binding protein
MPRDGDGRDAAPVPQPERTMTGEPPSPIALPAGCRFRTRCPRAAALCAADEPVMREVGPGRFAARHFAAVETGGAPAMSTGA